MFRREPLSSPELRETPSRLPNPACLLPGNGLSANPVLRGDGQPHGEISNLLYDTVDVGEVLTLSLPYGDVVLDDAGRPVVFASAGIGIAPMAGMLSHLVTAGSGLSITLLHTDEGAFSLRRQVVSGMLALRNAALHVWYEKQTQQPTGDQRAPGLNLADIDLPADAAYYMCGPMPFMQALRSTLIEYGVAPKDIQYEVSARTSGKPTSTDRTPGTSGTRR